MPRTYEVTSTVRFVNRMMMALVHLGLGPKQTYILTVQGRKNGKLYATPVSLVEENDDRWLVAPYGEVSWVKNARAVGEVTLRRGGHSETVRLTEVEPKQSAPVLKKYVSQETITQPYFDADPNASLEEFEAEAFRHPVFYILS